MHNSSIVWGKFEPKLRRMFYFGWPIDKVLHCRKMCIDISQCRLYIGYFSCHSCYGCRVIEPPLLHNIKTENWKKTHLCMDCLHCLSMLDSSLRCIHIWSKRVEQTDYCRGKSCTTNYRSKTWIHRLGILKNKWKNFEKTLVLVLLLRYILVGLGSSCHIPEK